MTILADRVKETSTTTGTGNFTLAGAVSAFRTFNAAIGVGPRFTYCIAESSGADWEVGEGYLSASTTLVRDTVFSSSNADALVNFAAGTKDVFVTIGADTKFPDWYGAAMYDDFSGSATALLDDRVALSGQTWAPTGAGAATATAGAGRFSSASNIYGVLPYGKQIPYLYGTFSFGGSGSRTTTSHVLIANQSSTTVLDNILHLQIFPSGWSLEKRIAGGSLDLITSGDLNLNTDGAIYSVGMYINKSTGAVTVFLPDGSQVTTASDAAIAALTLDQAIYQLPLNSGAFTAYWNSAAVYESLPVGQNRTPLGGAASIVDVAALKGDVLTSLQQWRGRFSTTAGWHRLITAGSWLTSCVAGTLWVSYRDSGGASQVFCVDVAGYWDATPILTERYENYFVARLISGVRVSRDSSTNTLALDINVALDEVGVRDFVAEWRGVGNLVSPPSSGATAYATETVTVTF